MQPQPQPTHLQLPVLGLQVVVMPLPPVYALLLQLGGQALDELVRGRVHPILRAQHAGGGDGWTVGRLEPARGKEQALSWSSLAGAEAS